MSSGTGTEDAIVISQQVLARCTELERSVADLEAQMDDVESRIRNLEGEIDG